MANVTETPTYTAGVYQLETTDPIIGGADGISNIQAKQLASRTAYLKVRTDQVDDAKGDFDSIGERIDAVQEMAEAVGPEMSNAVTGALKFALDQAAQANAGIRFLRNVWTQSGWLILTNRGVIFGCSVSKSTTATRNLNLSGGRCFAGGQEWPVANGPNAASVPSNTGSGSIQVVAYLYPEGYYNYALAVTAENEDVPENGIPIYNLVIPAGNTDSTDPGLTSVTITDIRRVEPDYPGLFDQAARAVTYIAEVPYDFYHLSLFAMSIDRMPERLPSTAVNQLGWARNGFTVELQSHEDNVIVFWHAFALRS